MFSLYKDDIISLDTPECAQLILLIKPYYRDLVYIMLRKSMYPTIDDSSWSLDDKEVFRCYRQDIADTFMYCYVVLNVEMLDILNTKLNEALKRGMQSDMRHPIQWNEVETVLHALGAISESIESENFYLPKLMNMIKNIPFNELNLKVMETSLETIGNKETTIRRKQLKRFFKVLIQSGLGIIQIYWKTYFL